MSDKPELKEYDVVRCVYCDEIGCDDDGYCLGNDSHPKLTKKEAEELNKLENTNKYYEGYQDAYTMNDDIVFRKKELRARLDWFENELNKKWDINQGDVSKLLKEAFKEVL